MTSVAIKTITTGKVVEAICFLFILLFVYAATSKILELEKFEIQVGQSPLLTGFGGVIPLCVIGAEFITSAFLATQRFQLLGLFASLSLMVMFTGYIIAIMTLADFVPCSCGGILDALTWREHLYLNVSFVLLAVIAIILHTKEQNSYREQS